MNLIRFNVAIELKLEKTDSNGFVLLVLLFFMFNSDLKSIRVSYAGTFFECLNVEFITEFLQLHLLAHAQTFRLFTILHI